MVNEARYLAWNCELKTRLGDIVLHLRDNYRQILTQQLQKCFLQCHFRACLHEGGGPQVGEVTRLGGVARLSI